MITGIHPEERGTSFSRQTVKPEWSIATSHFECWVPKYQIPVGCGKAIAAPNKKTATAIQIATRFINAASHDRGCGDA